MEESEKTEEPCRLCDENAEKMLSIFDKNEEGIEILQVIKDCIPIVVSTKRLLSHRLFCLLHSNFTKKSKNHFSDL